MAMGHAGTYLGQISQVSPHLYVSGVVPVQNADLLRQKRVACVINVTTEDTTTIPPSIVRELKDYIHIKVEDAPTADLSAYFDYVADKIASIKKNGGRTLVHCGAGVSRSPTLVLAYLVKYEDMTLRAAFYHLSAIRPVVSPNIGFWKQLITYEEALTKNATVQLRPVDSSVTVNLSRSLGRSQGLTRDSKVQFDYVSLVNSPTLFQPDVYGEKSKFRRDVRQAVSRTPPLRAKHATWHKYPSPLANSAQSSPKWPAKRLSQYSQDWNGRITCEAGLSPGHGYYKRYSTAVAKKGQGGIFESLTSMCDPFLHGL